MCTVRLGLYPSLPTPHEGCNLTLVHSSAVFWFLLKNCSVSETCSRLVRTNLAQGGIPKWGRTVAYLWKKSGRRQFTFQLPANEAVFLTTLYSHLGGRA